MYVQQLRAMIKDGEDEVEPLAGRSSFVGADDCGEGAWHINITDNNATRGPHRSDDHNMHAGLWVQSDTKLASALLQFVGRLALPPATSSQHQARYAHPALHGTHSANQ